uniref:Integrase catalytic domain-containing protein n=1 Tax=Nicotiana tabacum TaxID=4097 RepID=A0A1S4AMD1_TOBAC|nr:PREDICTED: uncharacterized protein LOC107799303 [Nicotiana tabacum]
MQILNNNSTFSAQANMAGSLQWRRHGGKKLIVVSLAVAEIKSRHRDTNIDVALWHKRLGHVSNIILRKLFSAKLASITDTINKCSVCPCAKQTELPLLSSYIKTTVAFDLIHLDVWGPYKSVAFDGNKYFLTVIDDFTRMTWSFLLKLKFDVCVVLAQLVVFFPTQFNKTMKAIRSDNGSEFVNSTLYNINRMPSSVLHGLSHFEFLYDRAPALVHLRILGCLCYAKKVHEVDKLLPRAKPVVLMGFYDTQKGYILLDLSSHCFFINRDVSFRDDIFPFKDISAPTHPIYLPPGSSSYSEEQFPSSSTPTSTMH